MKCAKVRIPSFRQSEKTSLTRSGLIPFVNRFEDIRVAAFHAELNRVATRRRHLLEKLVGHDVNP